MALIEPGSPAHRERLAAAPEPLIRARTTDCTECWACIRHCPAKAIRLADGVCETITDRCVQCGLCVGECRSGGFVVRDDLPLVRALLASGRPVVAVLASEHVAAMHPLTPVELERALESLGFAAAETTVLGEEIVAAAYEQVHMRVGSGLPQLRSTCPVAVNWVKHFYPQLVEALVPLVPPYIAQARLVREIYGPEVAIVYVSPCWARKDEIYDPAFEGAVDVAIGFDELRVLMADRRSTPASLESLPVRAHRPQAIKELSLTDGFPRRPVVERDLTDRDFVIVRGLADIDRLLRGMTRGELAPSVVDMLCCEGCVDGPAVNPELSVFAKRSLISAEYERQAPPPVDSRTFLSALPAIELRRSFEARPALTRVPTAEEIDAVLAAGEFFSREDALDCGACGHDTCVEMAAAICLGNSSWDLCFPLQRKLMRRERNELMAHAHVDPVTGLGNRRAFDLRLEEEVSRASRYGTSLSLMMIDLDRFKDINDERGHMAGDVVLGAVGMALAKTLRSTDIASRYGGDEFAVLLPGTGKTDAWAVAEKLRHSLHDLKVELADGSEVSLRASLGVASFGAVHDTAEGLLTAADEALYRAKHGGRDRVELAAG